MPRGAYFAVISAARRPLAPGYRQFDTLIHLVAAALVGAGLGSGGSSTVTRPVYGPTSSSPSGRRSSRCCRSMASRPRPVWPFRTTTRIPAQIVTGLGFPGAGAITKYGTNSRGLTTATSPWVVEPQPGAFVIAASTAASRASRVNGLARKSMPGIGSSYEPGRPTARPESGTAAMDGRPTG